MLLLEVVLIFSNQVQFFNFLAKLSGFLKPEIVKINLKKIF